MANSLLLIKYHFLLTVPKEAWIPSKGFLFGVLVIGAIFLAGVFLSAFTYYEDHYWGDEKFREELRFNSSRRDS